MAARTLSSWLTRPALKSMAHLRRLPSIPRQPNYAFLRSHYQSYTSAPFLSRLINIHPEVADAIANNRPVVALESTIYTHGALSEDFPHALDRLVREHGAIPAVCGVYAGVPTVGLQPAEIMRMVSEGAKKASRRDLAYLVGKGDKLHGGTTISGTMVLARLAGIRVFGTGGLGGVHRGGESSMDVSADLTELGRTRVAVVSSGCKGFLDIPRTLEYLETQGVLVATFADEGQERVEFPAFWARESGSPSPAVVRDEKEAAGIILAQEKLGIESGLLFANPIPKQFAIPRKDMEEIIATAVREAEEKGFTGNANTPYILKRIRELSQGKSVPANKALVEANVGRAARIAVELAKMLDGSPVTPRTVTTTTTTTTTTTSYEGFDAAGKPSAGRMINVESKEVEAKTKPEIESHPVDVLVAGSVALDLNCNYVGGAGSAESSDKVTPAMHTSNPSTIHQSIGGVGHNIARAAHLVSDEGKVRLCSMVGDDIAGHTILSTLQSSGLDTSCIRQLGHEYPSARTAQYVAVNDANKNLVMAMADMAIFSSHSFPAYWNSAVAAARPKWLVVDANWSEHDIQSWIQAGRRHGAKIIFEPVSVAKSQRLFPNLDAWRRHHHHHKHDFVIPHELPVHPRPLVDLATPNHHELLAMYQAAKAHGHLDTSAWFDVIDAFGITGRSSGRDRFDAIFSQHNARDLVDAGLPVQSISLLPYIPTLITKLGPRGALLTALLPPDDPRLRDPGHSRWVISRCAVPDHPHIGGVYMRLYPPAEKVPDQEVVSVNGIGDTFVGVLVAGLAMGGRVERLIDVAQRAAVLTLRSQEGVSEDVRGLRRVLSGIVKE